MTGPRKRPVFQLWQLICIFGKGDRESVFKLPLHVLYFLCLFQFFSFNFSLPVGLLVFLINEGIFHFLSSILFGRYLSFLVPPSVGLGKFRLLVDELCVNSDSHLIK